MPATFAQLCRLPVSVLLCTFATCAGAMDAPAEQVDRAALPDLKVVEVRLVDAGDAAQELGPCYRVTVRNDATVAACGFDVSLVAGIDFERWEETTEMQGRVEHLAGGQSESVDVRLPVEALALRRDAQGSGMAYRLLLVVLDRGSEIAEHREHNNRIALDRDEVRAVDVRLISSTRRDTSGGESASSP